MESHYTLAKKDVFRFVGGLLAVGALIGIGVGAIAFSGVQRTVTQSLTITSFVTSLQRVTETRTQFVTITQTMMNTSVATGTGAWREIKRFTGSADMTTEPFSVSSTMWRIRWSYGTSQFASFWFSVYQVGGTMYVENVWPTGPSGLGTTYIYKGPGDFYLKIGVANIAYTIIVEIPA